ncbi:hypothetical protein ACS0TY_024011 [Phlomoides rotata]
MFKSNKGCKRLTSWEGKNFKEETTTKGSQIFKVNNKGNFLNIHKESTMPLQTFKAAVQFPPGFNPGAKPPNNEGKPSQDEVMEAMFKKMDEFMKGTSGQIKTLEQQMGTEIKTLEHQMGQLASTVEEQHQKGKFPSTT